MSENKPLTKLSTLGEFGLIHHLTQDIKLKNKSSLKGVGDDAAVLDYLSETWDSLCEGPTDSGTGILQKPVSVIMVPSVLPKITDTAFFPRLEEHGSHLKRVSL